MRKPRGNIISEQKYSGQNAELIVAPDITPSNITQKGVYGKYNVKAPECLPGIEFETKKQADQVLALLAVIDIFSNSIKKNIPEPPKNPFADIAKDSLQHILG